MKKLKLWLHSKEYDENEVIFNPKEFPNVRVGDIFEIYHPEDDKDTFPGQPRLLLQVRKGLPVRQQTLPKLLSWCHVPTFAIFAIFDIYVFRA